MAAPGVRCRFAWLIFRPLQCTYDHRQTTTPTPDAVLRFPCRRLSVGGRLPDDTTPQSCDSPPTKFGQSLSHPLCYGTYYTPFDAVVVATSYAPHASRLVVLLPPFPNRHYRAECSCLAFVRTVLLSVAFHQPCTIEPSSDSLCRFGNPTASVEIVMMIPPPAAPSMNCLLSHP